MSLNESTVEAAALEWFGALGYAVGHGPHLAPGEPAAERDSFGEVVRMGPPSLTQTNRAFHRMLMKPALSRCVFPTRMPDPF